MQELKRVLFELSAQEFVFIPNPGNAGDSLINAASFQFLDDMKLNYKVISPREIKQTLKKGRSIVDKFNLKDKVIVLGGGGGFTEHYPYSNALVSALDKQVKQLILLPCTIEGYQETLSGLSDRVTVFCREKVSFEYLNRVCNGPTIYLSHDMVFAADFTRIMAVTSSLSSIRNRIKAAKSRAQVADYIKRNGIVKLNALRLDEERSDIEVPTENMDMSALFSLGTKTKATNFYAAQEFLSHLDKFEQVVTNRLHVCIASTLLGKQVTFLDNSYFKNRAVFDRSMGKFNNVKLVSELPS
ncbi:polysaccharide pyruvyl transferase family protein [Shewanella woodyi]|uniref:Exopolysaccharide biosynthesis protein-like protein n=1 Tax=Shewanella woodyi (strain ATCC 51908 / MS32) TaxID=392500 RepID=B1KL31_SHEWM|nr:polysaccharide pyruvyl transferase family protein [Shewanella woodyi]ACA84372.1 exopolysaccharide biosynthesis protein-like protein [Shewanella woodyi ATCC 51908]